MTGGVVAMAGLVLLVQNATDRFDTWAYAWALVLLAGAGTARWLVGVTRGRRDLVASGGSLIAAGLGGFLSWRCCSRPSSGSAAVAKGGPAATPWRSC